MRLQEQLRRQQVRSDLGKFFKAQVGWMRAFVILVCFLLTLAGLLGLLGQDILALGAIVLAAGLWLLGSLTHLVVSRHIAALARHAESVISHRMGDMMQSLVKGVVVSRVSAYRRLYTAPRRKVAEHEATLQPLMDRHSEVYRQLRAAAPHV